MGDLTANDFLAILLNSRRNVMAIVLPRGGVNKGVAALMNTNNRHSGRKCYSTQRAQRFQRAQSGTGAPHHYVGGVALGLGRLRASFDRV